MTLFINPGSGPVEGATAEHVVENIAMFCRDLQERGHDVSVSPGPPRDLGDGRWMISLIVDGTVRTIDMPGLPLEKVRYMDEDDQNIWDFPRLYVDGSSWVWVYALSVCRPADEDD